ncbi:MAG: NAD-dependent epimerase/dehydratase family protein [Dechloromonas sp.]|uniref:NAD-dependent epimerase/dehydratase family protein n=1 Tax=Candidatus Dechloromonas phosphorivorans TaxID=2899244 RepID=A0A935K6E7_9RHOO|nr:NAD-dependent epimerase/dehydratase family protein [Candidatus Dechloromonas phosphorivorans]
MDLITGATGFIGKRLGHTLLEEGRSCRTLSRQVVLGNNIFNGDLSDKPSLSLACAGIERVFHCAGYAHAFSSLSGDDEAMHWQVNFEGTRNLVEAAGQAGVRRFVFLSSVKAMAEPGEVCADEDFPGNPDTAYGESKRAAEIAVLAAGQRYGMHVVNLRLAMVYGAGGRGNLERMGRLVKRGWFPPCRRPAITVHSSMSMMWFRQCAWWPKIIVPPGKRTLLLARKHHPGAHCSMRCVPHKACPLATGRCRFLYCVSRPIWAMVWNDGYGAVCRWILKHWIACLARPGIPLHILSVIWVGVPRFRYMMAYPK